MDPVIGSALISAGGSFLGNYLQARAAEEAAKKQAEIEAERQKMEIEQNYASNQNRGFENMLGAYRAALLGG